LLAEKLLGVIYTAEIVKDGICNRTGWI